MRPSPSAVPTDHGSSPAAGLSAGGGRRPRLVPGGYDITALPLCVPAVPGEQLSSWLVRWAHRYALPVSQLLTELGIQVPSAPGARLERQLHRHAATLALAAGGDSLPPGPDPLGPGAHLRGEVSRYLASYHRHKTAVPARSRYCPQCLDASNGVWLESWSRPLHLVCVIHQVMLAGCCPDCRQARFTSTAWMTHDTPAWTCSEPVRHPAQPRQARTRYPVCGRDLRTVPAEPVNAAEVAMLVRLWQAADDAGTDPDRLARAHCGFPVSHRDTFDAVLELVVEHLGDVKPLLSSAARPAPLLLDAARVAFQVLDQPDPGAAVTVATQHRLLHPGGSVTPIGPDRSLGQRRRNPLLASIRLATLHGSLSPSTQLVFRSGSGRPRYPNSPGVTAAADQAQLTWVPQLIWPGQLTPWIDDRDYRDRASAAMLLAKVGSTRPWRFIALDLGLPANFAVYPANLVRYLKQDGLWPDVLARLDDLATRLEHSPPPINYQARRWAAARYDDVIAAVNHTMAYLGPPHRWCHTHMLTELFWQVYTGGDLRLAAPVSGTLLDPDLYHQDESYAEPLTDLPLLTFFTATASTLNRAIDAEPEPLTWRPPRSDPGSQPPQPAAQEGAGDLDGRSWAAADLSWAPALKLPNRGRPTAALVQEIVLAIAEVPADSHEMTPWIEAYLDTVYGIAHPDALADLVPAVTATYQAVNGTSHGGHLVDPTFRQQLRHTLNLDGRAPAARADVSWDIGQEWRPVPPPKRKTTPKTTVTTAPQRTVKQSVISGSTTRGKVTRLDRLESIVRAARRRQQTSASGGAPGY